MGDTEWMFLSLNGIFAASQISILLTLGDTKDQLIPLQTFCSIHRNRIDFGNTMRTNFEKWSMEDVQNFENHFLLDELFHPIIYVLAITSGIFYFGNFEKKYRDGRHYIRIYIFVILALAGICDCIENSFHKSIISNLYNKDLVNISNDTLWNACIFARTKWIIIFTVF